jgi:hypothetical protein
MPLATEAGEGSMDSNQERNGKQLPCWLTYVETNEDETLPSAIPCPKFQAGLHHSLRIELEADCRARFFCYSVG